MRKRYHKFNHNDGLLKVKGDVSKKKKSKKTNKKNLKFALYSLLTVFIVMVGYVLYSYLVAANSVFVGGVTFADLVSRNSLKQQDGVTNVLFLGKGGSNHPGGQLTDTILLLRLRHKDDKVAMISIPRDLYVAIPGNGQAKINKAYTTGFNSTNDTEERGKAGAEVASEVVSEVAGVPVHYYVTADFTGFKEIVDTIGGVTVDVEKELYDPEYPKEGFTSDGQYYKTEAYDPLLIEAGIQSMDGELALKYARSRHGTGVSDFDRAYRQQQILYAIKERSLSLGVLASPSKVTDIASSVGNHIRISMSPSELREFIEMLSKTNQGSVINEVLSNSEDGLLVSANDGSTNFLPKAGNYSQIHAFIRNVFDAVVLKEVDIEILNGSDVTGRAGELATKLEKAGFNITKIDNYEGEMEKTTVRDGTSKGKVYEQLSGYLGQYEHTGLDRRDVIVIVIGQDYGD